ncbi:leucine rich repeat protein [Plakobranchus ocellatus]|uniref:Leucine rich repeat protein n=1 Tax=Plakobranchus ocellatus TaxID=259542 RepID=A0AAV3Z1S9_9GAST|nr:leucine rich repeat protein [Plakobranchus ocellatus]
MSRQSLLLILAQCAIVIGFSHTASLRQEAVQDFRISEQGAATLEANPVNLTLYFESLCGACQEFIVHQVVPTWSKLEASGILQVHLIPFGNAKETKVGEKYTFECQHGPDECQGNIVETCTIHYFPKEKDHIVFIGCFEQKYDESHDWQATLETCAKAANFSQAKVAEISQCVSGDLGNTLEHAMAARTGPHQWVPWILLDGVLNMDAETRLLELVCDAYKGAKPTVCSK